MDHLATTCVVAPGRRWCPAAQEPSSHEWQSRSGHGDPIARQRSERMVVAALADGPLAAARAGHFHATRRLATRPPGAAIHSRRFAARLERAARPAVFVRRAERV